MSVRGGGFWPGSTLNQYVFSSGIELAGIIDSAALMTWAGQPEGAFFFNLRGGTNAAPLTDVWRSSNSSDAANWPDAARVPQGDASADLFAPALQGQIKASDQDIWFLSWEGDPSLLSGRTHTMGVLVETRIMSFATAGRQDFFFMFFTFYNITCDGTVFPGCYAAARPAMRDTLIAVSHRFHQLNNAAFPPFALPAQGYRLQDVYFGYTTDDDVTVEASGSNYGAVNVPFGMGYSYHESFAAEPSWHFDPGIYRAPFFAGAGFVGVKYLRTPAPTTGQAGLSVFGDFTSGGTFSNPPDTKSLYRQLSGNPDPAQGDDVCNVGDVHLTHICYVDQGTSADMRYFESTGGFDLAPGDQATIALAYLFAPPVAVGGCNRPDCQSAIPPQSPSNSLLRFLSPDSVILGVNTVDSMTGYAGYLGDVNGDGLIQSSEIRTVPGSLLGKAQTAQALFDSRFAQPEAPLAPSFYLLSADAEVTVLWQPSATETGGDPYFADAQQPQSYDPNYRQKDVIGYRVYRGNGSNPSQLRLLAQFNYSSGEAVHFTDHTGQINAGRLSDCAPELQLFLSCTSAGTVNGVATIDPVVHDVLAEGPLVQSVEIVPVEGGEALTTIADTAFTGRPSVSACGSSTPCPALSDSGGVPFLFVDRTVTNNHTYYYAVTAFDLNSIRSGPSSLESVRQLKPIVPAPLPTGIQSSQSISTAMVGRGLVLTGTDPTLDSVTGEFSGPQLPSNAAGMTIVPEFVGRLFQGVHTVDVTLTDIRLGDARKGYPALYTFRITGPADTLDIQMSLQPGIGFRPATGALPPLDVIPVDPQQAHALGVDPHVHFMAQFSTSLEPYQVTNSQGRGCIDATISVPFPYVNCRFYGPRWFTGANESTPNPNAGNSPFGSTASNAGALTGVVRIQWPSAFANYGNGWRATDASMSAAIRAADFKFYWGNAGKVDSVIDVTHNVVVPFQASSLGGGWGIMTQQASNFPGSRDGRPGVVTVGDLGCVEPMFSDGGTFYGMGVDLHCTAASAFNLVDSAVAGPIAIAGGDGTTGSLVTEPPADNPGFVIWIAGEMFSFELAPGAPVPSNTVWTLRSYIGSIFQSNAGAYSFRPGLRSFSAIGATLRLTYTADNRLVPLTGENGSVANVHTVPDPYYRLRQVAAAADLGVIRFVNLPPRCTIRIYTANGILVRVLQHNNVTTGTENWDIRNRNGQIVGSGVYFYSAEDSHTGIRRVGRMTVVN